MQITIIDYGVGNLKSISNTFNRLNETVMISRDPEQILASDLVILPGVGAFQAAMSKLRSLQLESVIQDYVASQKPLLGICVGMQILLTQGFEIEECSGLNFVEGTVEKIPTSEKLPHIGWNQLLFSQTNTWATEHLTHADVYFVHSYYCKMSPQFVVAYTEYGGVMIPAIIAKENIYATQFHPEKSGPVGQQFLKNFLQHIKEQFYAN